MAITWEGAAPSTKTTTEVRRAPSRWRQIAADVATPVLETLGTVGGTLVGGVLSAPGGLPSIFAGSVAGAGLGSIAGTRAARGVSTLLGAGLTPEQAARTDMDAFASGAYADMLGPVGGKILGGLSTRLSGIRSPRGYAEIGAGKEIAKSRELSVAEQQFVEPRAKEVQNALMRVGAPKVPRSVVTGSERDVALESISRPRIGGQMEAQKRVAQEQAAKQVDSAIPTQQRSADIVRDRITAHNEAAAQREIEAAAARQEVIERINTLRQQQAEKAQRLGTLGDKRQTQALEDQFAKDFEKRYGQPLVDPTETPTQAAGARIYAAAEQAEKIAASRFASKEWGYQQPKFVEAAPADADNALTRFVAQQKPPVNFSAHADPESALARMLSSAENAEAMDIPATFDYSTLRSISEAAGKAQRRAARSLDGARAADYFGRVKGAAESTIKDIIGKSAGDTAVAEYAAINKLYATQQVPAFRSKTIGMQVLGAGDEAEGVKTASAGIAKLFDDTDNIRDLMRAFGTKQVASRPGRAAMEEVPKEEILLLGRNETAEVLRPYYERKLYAVYSAAGGGAKGALAAQKWLQKTKNTDVLDLLGLRAEFDQVGQSAKSLQARMQAFGKRERVSPKLERDAVVNQAVDLIGVDDPYKVYSYTVGAPDVTKRVTELMRVSADPAYRAGVKELLRDGIKLDMEQKGLNPFTAKTTGDKRVRALLPLLYSKSEIRALKDFHTIMDATGGIAAKGVRHEVEQTAAEKAAEKVAMVHVGYPGYGFKYGAMKGLRGIGSKYQAEINVALDKAAVDPEYADALLKAYRGYDSRPLKRLVEALREEQTMEGSIIKKLIPAYAAAEHPTSAEGYDEAEPSVEWEGEAPVPGQGRLFGGGR